MRNMFIYSDQLNNPYNNNAHISFFSKQLFFLCAVHTGENANELTLPEQGDKTFDSSVYNVFGSISFVLHRHFSSCCLIRRLVFPTYL